MTQPSPVLIDRDVAYAAMCIIEEMIHSRSPDMPQPWNPYWDQVGVNEMRFLVIDELAAHADAAWCKAYDAFCNAAGMHDVADPGSFDYDFVPIWVRHCVDWPAGGELYVPRVRNPAILAAHLAAQLPAPNPVLACPECGDSDHLYDRADVRYDFETGDWVIGDREGTIDCTECDWNGAESELVPAEAEERTNG